MKTRISHKRMSGWFFLCLVVLVSLSGAQENGNQRGGDSSSEQPAVQSEADDIFDEIMGNLSPERKQKVDAAARLRKTEDVSPEGTTPSTQTRLQTARQSQTFKELPQELREKVEREIQQIEQQQQRRVEQFKDQTQKRQQNREQK